MSCSVPKCQNLLNPTIPWKMCETCRDIDRENRRIKRLRELGELPPLVRKPKASVVKKYTKPPAAPADFVDVVMAPPNSTQIEDAEVLV